MAKIYGNTVTTPMPVADWNQTDENKADYIKNKPTILTEEDVVEIMVENGGIGGGDGSTGVLVSVEEVYVGTEPPTNEDVKIWVNPDGESTGGAGFGSSGFSPIIDVDKEGDVTTLTITDVEGTKTVTINDGEDGQDGVGIASIKQTVTSTVDGGDNVVTVTLTDGQVETFVIKNGTTGSGDSTGESGEDGFSPTITANKIGKETTLTITDVNGTQNVVIYDGADGVIGQDGVGIQSIQQTTTSTTDGGNNVVTVTLTDGQTSTFTVKNGTKGSDGSAGQNGSDGFSPTITANKVGKETTISITDKNGSNEVVIYDGADGVIGKDGEQGIGIQSITQTTTSTEDNGVNELTVTLTDNTSHTFEVRNGSKGSDGTPGQAGKTPVKGTDYFTQSDINDMVDATYTKISNDNLGMLNTRFGNIPSYHYDEVGRVVKQILTLKKAHPNHIVFGAISDNHIDHTNAESMTSVRHAVFALENVGAFSHCDFIANLGDNIKDKIYDSFLTDAIYMDNISGYTLKSLNAYNLVGNHDKSENTAMLFDFIGKYNSFDNHGTTKLRGYGYDDYEDKKVRVICLNTCDYWNTSGGNGMSYEQKEWFMSALDLSKKESCEEWMIVILSHIPLDFLGGDYNKAADLKAILSAYNSKGFVSIECNCGGSYKSGQGQVDYDTYNGKTISYNYAESYQDKSLPAIVNIHGHLHNNIYGKLKYIDDNTELDIIRISTPNSSCTHGETVRYPEAGDYSVDTQVRKVPGSAKDTSATFYFIDLDTNIVYSVGYGADTDRTISLGELQPNNYFVRYELTNCTNHSNNVTAIAGASYIATIKLATGYELYSCSITMGGAVLTEDQYSMSNDGETVIITINEVTGSIVITAVAEIDLPYNNLFDPSKEGFADAVRFSSDGSTTGASGYVSNYIKCSVGDTIYVRCPDGTYAEGTGLNNRCIAIYNSNKTALFVSYPGDMPEGTFDDDGKGFHYTVIQEGAEWFRVAGNEFGKYQNFVVTVNEPILGEEE